MAVPQIAIDAATHYLRDKGCPRGPAIGMVSVFYAGESGLKTGAQGNTATDKSGVLGSGAVGIASWNGPRQAALKAFAAGKIEDPFALNTQLDFALTEMFNAYPVSKSAYLAGLPWEQFIPVFVRDYERPANPQSEIDRSLAFAAQLDAALPEIVPAAPAPAPAPAHVTPAPIPAAPAAPATGISIMDPAILAIILQVIEALAAGFAKGTGGQILTQLGQQPTASPSAPAATTAAPFDLGALAGVLAPIITSQISQSIPQLIAAEIAKIIPQTVTPGTKP